MAELEAEAFLIGQWRNFEEMETNLSLPELEVILDAEREKQFRQNKFLAAMKGIDLEGGAARTKTAEERIEEAYNRARAKLAGVSEQEMEFASLGFGVEEE